MTAIEASSAGVRDMADGSLRITLEFEPRHAREAYALFGARGTPVAVAALKVGHAAVQEPKGGPLAREAGKLDSNPAFQDYAMARNFPNVRDFILDRCCINSRRELDHRPEAARLFRQMMRNFADEQKVAA